jgi:uncharacterized membrane protein
VSRIGFESPLGIAIVAGLLAAAVAGWGLMRLWLGPAAPLARRGELLALRGLIVASVLAVLFNPVRVTKSPGAVERPEVFLLVDSSQSMSLGSPKSRWDEALETMRSAARSQLEGPARLRLFRFGQRLLASDGLDALVEESVAGGGGALFPGLSSSALAATTPASAAPKGSDAPLAPTDTDTQLLTALRQISSRFGHKPPKGIVVFSDGRARDDVSVEETVSQFARLKVPVHVFPTGSLGQRGDISIVAAVVPPRVRKFSEVEVQVFLRSFGFDGHRTEVELTIPDRPGKPGTKLASTPVTLRSGFQAVTATFRSSTESHPVRVGVPAVKGEISESNNALSSDVGVDRTKIRVLYLEGSTIPISAAVQGGKQVLRGPHSDVSQALMTDDDIECVVVSTGGGRGSLYRVSETGLDSSRAFPETKAELAAFDAIILSDFPERMLTETQVDWIREWVEERGGGLLMAGGPGSFTSGGWDKTKLADVLPVEMLAGADWNSGEQIQWKPLTEPKPHPVWMLYTEERRTLDALAAVPPFTGANRFSAVKPNLTVALADSAVVGAVAPPKKSPPPPRDPNLVQDIFRRLVGGDEPETPAERQTADGGTSAALVLGRFGKGRTAAMSTAIAPPWASDFALQWKQGDQSHHTRFWRNLVYWLTENSSIGRRRLVASADKRFYNPGDELRVSASAFNESARRTKDYRIVAMVEPNGSLRDTPGDYSPLKWPAGMPRESGEEGPFIAWGEEIELPLVEDGGQPGYSLMFPIAEMLQSGAANQSLRLELTAYEDLTQVDSTSLDVQILHDPFELQNPFPNHELLERIARLSGGRVLSSSAELERLLQELPVTVGPPRVARTPIWSTWWMWTWLAGLLTIEWVWRRKIGLA